jgi:hypothetical protein
MTLTAKIVIALIILGLLVITGLMDQAHPDLLRFA